MKEYERQNGPLLGHKKVGGWLRDVQAAYESDGPSYQPYPQPSARIKTSRTRTRSTAVRCCDGHWRSALGLRRSPLVSRIKNAVLYVLNLLHKDYEGYLSPRALEPQSLLPRRGKELFQNPVALPVPLELPRRTVTRRGRVCLIGGDTVEVEAWTQVLAPRTRQSCLNLNVCKVMTVFLIFLGQNLKKIVINFAEIEIQAKLS